MLYTVLYTVTVIGTKKCNKSFSFFLDKMLYRMVCIVCVLHEPITVQARQGMELVIFLGRDDSYDNTLAIYMNYLSMRLTFCPWH